MKRLKTRVKKFFCGNLSLKILSVLLAIATWIVVLNINDPVVTLSFVNVPVEIQNMDVVEQNGMVCQVVNNTGEVTLKVRAKRSLKLRASDFTVTADLENLNFANTVPLTVKCTSQQISTDSIVINPPSLKVSMEEKSEKEFMLNLEPVGTPASGKEVGTITVKNGKTVLIAGPKSLISKINKVLVNVPVQGMDTSRQGMVCDLKIMDKNGDYLTDSQMNTLEIKNQSGIPYSDKTVQIDVDLWNVKDDIRLDITTVGEPEDGYYVSAITTTPSTISLAGTDDALKELKGVLVLDGYVDVSGKNESFEVELNLMEILAQHEELEQITGDSPEVKVKVQIEKRGSQLLEISVADIEILNAPEDMDLVLTPADKILIPVLWQTEKPSETPQIDPEQVHVSLDLANYRSEGTYSIPVSVELPEGLVCGGEIKMVVNMKNR